MISIICVTWNSYDFLHLLIESLERFTTIPYSLIVIDNSENRLRIPNDNVYQFFMPNNIGHGRGLNHGVAKAFDMFPSNPYIMFLDVDCHVLGFGWEFAFANEMKTYDIIGGRGVPSKPIRPACMFMKREIARYDWADTTGYRGNRVTPEGFDVAIKAYYRIMADGHEIGFLESGESNRYGTANGEEWCINGDPLVYHHWHGSHIPARQADFPDVDLTEDKLSLFSKIPWRLP